MGATTSATNTRRRRHLETPGQTIANPGGGPGCKDAGTAASWCRCAGLEVHNCNRVMSHHRWSCEQSPTTPGSRARLIMLRPIEAERARRQCVAWHEAERSVAKAAEASPQQAKPSSGRSTTGRPPPPRVGRRAPSDLRRRTPPGARAANSRAPPSRGPRGRRWPVRGRRAAARATRPARLPPRCWCGPRCGRPRRSVVAGVAVVAGDVGDRLALGVVGVAGADGVVDAPVLAE